MNKTNALRILDREKIEYETREYAFDENDLDGNHAADAIGMPRERVFKTLVTRSAKGGLFVFCLPVCAELDLKKAARAAGEKSLEMIHVKELVPLTGYMRGGCSPVGMKKSCPTVIDEGALVFDSVAFSAGQRGLQMIVEPTKLAALIFASFCDITK